MSISVFQGTLQLLSSIRHALYYSDFLSGMYMSSAEA